ncbi:hypothetical protein QBC46DRAFT_273246 [Diplogelasinospora grovesii]|uniref:Uncharacterized protein n=1 Tax=Diplogelasinospora grovesii TaxID=303347 RepID=A0AAN6MYB9_9PEZI|nr:hypothetical protein QBC46DRAFT_273246 [Diplogelasinospora grovesii]
MACTLPFIQILAQLITADPLKFQVFNVPLFNNDCSFLALAQPIMTDGWFIPSTAVRARFSSDSFIDSTGNPLD